MMDINKDRTVAQIVTDNIKASHIFKKYDIDFCCGGGVTLAKVCEKKSVDYETLKNELLDIDIKTEDSNDYKNWDLAFLIDYIVNIHHTYVTESLPILSMYATKVAHVHGHHYQEVVQINDLVQAAIEDLSGHLMKEEQVLFPFIKQLVQAKKDGVSPPQPHFSSVQNPIRMMESEHDVVGNIFKEISQLSNNFTPPPEACNTFRALYDKLNEFEQDLHKHIHLENNILHPKAIALEKSFYN